MLPISWPANPTPAPTFLSNICNTEVGAALVVIFLVTLPQVLPTQPCACEFLGVGILSRFFSMLGWQGGRAGLGWRGCQFSRQLRGAPEVSHRIRAFSLQDGPSATQVPPKAVTMGCFFRAILGWALASQEAQTTLMWRTTPVCSLRRSSQEGRLPKTGGCGRSLPPPGHCCQVCRTCKE